YATPGASRQEAEVGRRVRGHGARTTRGWRSPRTREGQRRARRSRVRRSAEASMGAYQPPGMRLDICDCDIVRVERKEFLKQRRNFVSVAGNSHRAMHACA